MTTDDSAFPDRAAVAAPIGLYLHIPFCQSICNYCNFNRGLLDDAVKRRYVDALETEIVQAGDGSRVDSIYFGGGTPSLLSAEEVARLIAACHRGFDLAARPEITLETNPETVSRQTVEGWVGAGITRISLGVQSFIDADLGRLGRRHTADRAREAVVEAKRGGADVSVDLMLWLPIQTRGDCAASVDVLVALEPDHASLYMLELYPNAPLREEMARGGWSQAPDEDAVSMYLDSLARLEAEGWQHYEISNVARPGKRCRHNLKYWMDGAWLGFGCGAHSTRYGCRWSNVSEVDRYVDEVGAGRAPTATRRRLDRDEQLGDALVTGLRLVEGVDLAGIEDRYGVDVMRRFGSDLELFFDAGVLVHDAGRLRLTRPGMLVANEVMRAFV